jgi:hypothetical protein
MRRIISFSIMIIVFTASFIGCTTYFGKPSTPAEDRVELTIPDVLQLVGFDDLNFAYKLHGVVTFDAGVHSLRVRYMSESVRGYYEPAGESEIGTVTYQFLKGRKYVLDYDLHGNTIYPSSISFKIVPAEDYILPRAP